MPAGSSPPLFSIVTGPAWIVLGLLLMIAGGITPAVPVVTAIALIAMGTTEVVLSRQSASSSRASLVLVHGMTYTLLYLLFVGARLYAPAATHPLVSLFTMLDLAISVLPMAIVTRRVFTCLRVSLLSRH